MYMRKISDFKDKKFGILTAISVETGINELGEYRTHWNVVCECGKKKKMRADHLKKAKSCGCLRHEKK